eukprot:gb/GECG01011729.1/.p1 GENE.gb/GECG01011729.1/~~gb/GECG01011729.1/.p1  ORF type:complete len:831 (+),score=100.52 gb/GECG01011729.1/:1-2493(+)
MRHYRVLLQRPRDRNCLQMRPIASSLMPTQALPVPRAFTTTVVTTEQQKQNENEAKEIEKIRRRNRDLKHRELDKMQHEETSITWPQGKAIGRQRKNNIYPSNRPDHPYLPEETYVHGMLAKAKHPADVLAVYEAEKDAFDLVNYCHGLQKIAKLHLDKAPWKREALSLSQVQSFVEDLQEVLVHTRTALAPRTLAGIAWGVGKLNFHSPELFDRIAANCLAQVGRFNHGDVAQLLYGMSRVGYYHRDMLNRLSSHIQDGIQHYSTVELTNILVSYASLRHQDRDLFGTVAQQLKQNRDELNPQQLANIVYSFGKAEIMDLELFSSFMRPIIDQSNRFTSQGIANTLWAYDKVGMYDATLFSVLAKNMGHPQRAKHATPQNIANACRAVSRAYSAMLERTDVHSSVLKRDLHIERMFTETAKALVRHLDPEASGISSHQPQNLPHKRRGQYKPVRPIPVNGHDMTETAEAFQATGIRNEELSSKLCSKVSSQLRSMPTSDIARFYGVLPYIATPNQASRAILALQFYKSVNRRILKNLNASELSKVLRTSLLLLSPPEKKMRSSYDHLWHPMHSCLCEVHRRSIAPEIVKWHRSLALGEKDEHLLRTNHAAASSVEASLEMERSVNRHKILENLVKPGIHRLSSRRTEIGNSDLVALLYDMAITRACTDLPEAGRLAVYMPSRDSFNVNQLSSHEIAKIAYSIIRLSHAHGHLGKKVEQLNGTDELDLSRIGMFFKKAATRIREIMEANHADPISLATFAWAAGMFAQYSVPTEAQPEVTGILQSAKISSDFLREMNDANAELYQGDTSVEQLTGSILVGIEQLANSRYL